MMSGSRPLEGVLRRRKIKSSVIVDLRYPRDVKIASA